MTVFTSARYDSHGQTPRSSSKSRALCSKDYEGVSGHQYGPGRDEYAASYASNARARVGGSRSGDRSNLSQGDQYNECLAKLTQLRLHQHRLGSHHATNSSRGSSNSSSPARSQPSQHGSSSSRGQHKMAGAYGARGETPGGRVRGDDSHAAEMKRPAIHERRMRAKGVSQGGAGGKAGYHAYRL